MRTSLLVLALAVSLPAGLARAAGPSRSTPRAAAPSRGASATPPTSAPGGAGTAGFKLKAGAEGKVCIECHGDFQKILALPVVHTPVRSRNCVGCHSPHASHRARFLADEPNRVCAGCHGDMTPASSKSTHKPVADRLCLSCHDPHASTAAAVLVKPAMDLCGTCHKALVERAATAKYKHAPVQGSGCITCHEAHASATAPHVLKKDVPALCIGCHRIDRPIFAKKHMDYPVGKSSCTSCHDPHGSEKRGLLYDRVHAPVARAMCAQCHQPALSATPFATKAAGAELCRTCHGPMVAKTFGRNRVHLPLTEGKSCLNCHNPHAAKQAALLSRQPKALCGSCHADTIQREVRSPAHHPPVRDGECMSCHDPHSGDAALMLVKDDPIELCQTCHDWGKHSSHPLGAKVADPRNPNRSLECLSCHRSHGTEYKKLAPFGKQSELCTSCHQQFRR